MSTLSFTASDPCTLGVELELQLVNTQNYNLTTDAPDLLRGLSKIEQAASFKPEITQSMIEINSSVHRSYGDLVVELQRIRDDLSTEARRMNVGVCGGGSHPFQKWSDRRIFPAERFNALLEKYGYLAKQFTVFGQHIHVGCSNGDEALYVAHALGRYVPHFVALAAASPYFQGEDTGFDSCRLTVVNAFPLSGVLPFVHRWADFETFYDKMLDLKVIESMKDFYWDIRPKPEYGTVEIRVCDTPLTVEKAALLAAYAQALARYIVADKPFQISQDQYLLYNVNRFHACRHGLKGNFIDPYRRTQTTIGADIIATLRALESHARALQSTDALSAIMTEVAAERNDAAALRKTFAEVKALPDLVRSQTKIWMKN
jgi:glutamate---cysteine ligase / carboxylate-amine ligase